MAQTYTREAKTRARILRAITDNYPNHYGTIAQDTGYTIATVKRHVADLLAHGMIENAPIDGHAAYFVVTVA